jgi:hypothetical protein
MAKRIKQYRYYNEANNGVTKNQPSKVQDESGEMQDTSYKHYVSGLVFGSYFPVLQLGIQALPGTKFYLNNAVDPIVIGLTGIWEVDLDGQTEITAIQIDNQSIQNIANNPNAYLIIDVIYDDGEV